MQYHVNGMDCASCVGKIESALSRMTGVSDVQLNFSTKKLSLTLDPDDKTTVKDIEKTIKSLGFDITEVSESPDDSSVDAYNSYEDQHWWQSKKGRQVIGLGVLMSAAYILSIVFPNYGSWVFALAVLIGVLIIIAVVVDGVIVFCLYCCCCCSSWCCSRSRCLC